MRSLVILAPLLILVACSGDDGAPQTYEGALVAEVTHYDYAFDLESRAAHATVTAHVTKAGNCIALPFRAEGLANVVIDGAPATSGGVDAGVLTACSAHGTAADATLVLDVDVTIPLGTIATSQVGFSKTLDSANNPFYYLVSWVNGCDKFGPCDARPDQFATYRFTVTHPETLMVACPGTLSEPSATETVCDFAMPGGPTYSTFGAAAYPKAAWVPTDKGMWGSVHATVYARPATLVADGIDAEWHAGFVSYMERTFGAFPFGPELRVLAAPTYWSGFEHPGNIMLDDALGRATSPYAHNAQHVLDHEIAHQWAGDQTTLADTYDFVWKESMAEYLAYTFEDMRAPADALQTASYWKAASMGAMFFPVPGEKPALFEYYGDVYGPGPMVLFRQIEAMSSREKVIAALKTLLGTPHAIGVDEVVAALQTSTGLDLTAYAAAWIHGSGAPAWPTIKTTYTANGATATVQVEQMTAKTRRCAFHVALHGAAAADVQLVAFDLLAATTDTVTQTVTTPTFAVTRVELDPLRECLVFPAGTTLHRTVPQPWLSARALGNAP